MKHKVIIYTTHTCTFCRQAKAFFKEHNIEYKEVDVGSNQKAAEEMVEKSGQMGVPVIEIDDETVIIGFDKSALMKELDLK